MRILAAVLGRPIAHSLSPLLHRSAFAALKLESSQYSRFDLGADELEAFLDAHPEHTGFSLTMPLKDRLVALAGERGWTLEDTAELTGAANTLVRTGQQVQVANTDVRGIVRAIVPHLPAGTAAEGSGPADARATILGAGATAASALVACRALGIGHVDFLVRRARSDPGVGGLHLRPARRGGSGTPLRPALHRRRGRPRRRLRPGLGVSGRCRRARTASGRRNGDARRTGRGPIRDVPQRRP